MGYVFEILSSKCQDLKNYNLPEGSDNLSLGTTALQNEYHPYFEGEVTKFLGLPPLSERPPRKLLVLSLASMGTTINCRGQTLHVMSMCIGG